jgi:uncharacterized protein (TIGR03084 family)
MSEPRTALLHTLVDDLTVESADLDARVAPLDDDAWSTPTPAAGWDIRDTINHLRFFDRDALLAVTDPAGFAGLLAGLGDRTGNYVERLTGEGRGTPPADVLAAWRTGREALADALRGLDPAVRVPWFGPPMSPASFVTARLMETWAHGQDVVDALGQVRPATDRLRSVAEIGYRARPFSYAVRGLAVPDRAVRGTALDFCLLVTQRRHRDDLALDVTGPAAAEWMGIAQAFAGPPGAGREPRR